MIRTKRYLTVAALLLTVLLTGGCFGLGGNRSTVANTGKLSMFLVDAPANGLKAVNVRINRVEVNHDGKWETFNDFTANGGYNVNLLTLRFDKDLLGQVTLPAGAYSQIRLIVDEAGSNVVSETGAVYPLKVPSGPQTGLKINHNFYIPAGGSVALVLDVNVAEFAHQLGNKMEFSLRPTAVRVVDFPAGNIRGTVLNAAKQVIDTDVVVTLWQDRNNDGIPDDAFPATSEVDYVAQTLALKEPFDDHIVGEFQLNAIPAGNYIVDISANGYLAQRFVGVTVTANSDTVIDADPLTVLPDPVLLTSAQ